jgi:hypothetical protein
VTVMTKFGVGLTPDQAPIRQHLFGMGVNWGSIPEVYEQGEENEDSVTECCYC